MEQPDKPLLLYVYDAMCGWCYGFSPVIKQASEVFADDFYFVAVSGGMMVGDSIKPVASMADYIKKAIPRVEEMTEAKFGEGYIKLIDEGSYVLNSIKPGIAMTAFKSFYPFRSIEFAHDLQKAHMGEGKNLNERAVYLELIKKYSIEEKEFLERVNSEECREQTYREFEEVKRIGITGFPSVLVQQEDSVYLLGQGFLSYEELAKRMVVAKENINNPE